jgi:hypothetical protein
MTIHTELVPPYQAGAIVFDVADPDHRGKIIRAGIEVSEIRFDDGAERNVPNKHLRAATNVELDNPVQPEPIDDTVRKGQDAWQRLKSNPTWQDWRAVGKAHVIGRAAAMRDGHVNKPKGRSYNAAFSAWQKKFGFQDLDSGDRTRLFQVMDHLKEIDAWLQKLPESERLRLNHPSSVLRKWKAATAKGKADPNAPPKVSPAQKLKDSLINLQEENDRMKREIARGGGDLWSADDRPKHIARVILSKLSKSKAEKVAREILNALKTPAEL